MADFLETTRQRVPHGFRWPEELNQLFAWVQAQGLVTEEPDGELVGTLSKDRSVGTDVTFRAAPPGEMTWPDEEAKAAKVTVWVFARTGFDGSAAALWLAPDGQQYIVHLGGISGSVLYCVLGQTPIDFIRLLAIGYEEVCWNEDWNEPPEPEDDHTVINAPFVDWVTSTFGVTIPRTGLEIVPEPAELGDRDTSDPWCRHVNDVDLQSG